ERHRGRLRPLRRRCDRHGATRAGDVRPTAPAAPARLFGDPGGLQRVGSLPVVLPAHDPAVPERGQRTHVLADDRAAAPAAGGLRLQDQDAVAFFRPSIPCHSPVKSGASEPIRTKTSSGSTNSPTYMSPASRRSYISR